MSVLTAASPSSPPSWPPSGLLRGARILGDSRGSAAAHKEPVTWRSRLAPVPLTAPRPTQPAAAPAPSSHPRTSTNPGAAASTPVPPRLRSAQGAPRRCAARPRSAPWATTFPPRRPRERPLARRLTSILTTTTPPGSPERADCSTRRRTRPGATGTLDGRALTAAYATSQTWTLHSRPAATRKIFLDFDGVDRQDTAWNRAGTGQITNGTHIGLRHRRRPGVLQQPPSTASSRRCGVRSRRATPPSTSTSRPRTPASAASPARRARTPPTAPRS